MGKNKVIQNVAILAGLFLFILIIYFLINNSNFLSEKFAVNEDDKKDIDRKNTKGGKYINSTGKGKGDEDFVENFSHNASATESVPGCLPKQQLMPQELLPQDSEANQWSNVNPQGSGSLLDKNFLQAGYHVGINTVGQTLRNANMQLRSDPVNPQVQVSPWLQTTINPDTNRKPFEIGGCA